MAQVEVLYGFPRRAYTETEILEAVAALARHFDENPTSMAAVVWRDDDVVWVAFECTSLGHDRAMTRDHFAETLLFIEDAPELVVAGRRFGDEVDFQHWVGRERRVFLSRAGHEIVGEMPNGERTNGSPLDIGLRLASLAPSRPFERESKPDGFVWMRRDRAVPDEFEIVTTVERLPIGVAAPNEGISADAPRFAMTPHRLSIEAQAAPLVDATWTWVVSKRPALPSARDIETRAHQLAELGPVVASLVVRRMEVGDGGAKGFALGALTLGRLGLPKTAPALVKAFDGSSKVRRATAFHGLATMNEAAWGALEEGASARKKGMREPCEALLALLCDKKHAHYHEIRRLRDGMNPEIVDELRRLLKIRYGEDADAEVRRARRRDLLLEYGGAALAVLLATACNLGKLVDGYEIVAHIRDAADDPLTPFAVALVCAEHWLPNDHLSNVMDRTKLKAAARKVLDARFRRASKTFALLPKY